MARRRRDKIKFSYENYITTLTEEELAAYNTQFAPLIDMISESAGDAEIMERAKAFDAENDADMFSEAVNMKVYCIPCQKVQCDCCF